VLRVIADTNVYVFALHVGGVADDPDNRILECALRAEAQMIVTGDRLPQALGSFRGTTVVSPRQFLDALAPGSPQG